jgi:hypothetical protein
MIVFELSVTARISVDGPLLCRSSRKRGILERSALRRNIK